MLSILKTIIPPLLLILGLVNSSFALSSYKEVRKSYIKSDSILLDRRGEPLYELRTDHTARRLDWITLHDVSPSLLLAVIFAEDKRFFDHTGVDYNSIAAVIIGGVTPENLRGASTISMQLVSILNHNQPKNCRRTVRQKINQIIEASELEKKWSKKEILEVYINLIYFHGELQGIDAASRGLFGKAPHGIDQVESLLLASLIRSPNAAAADFAKRSMLLRDALGWPVDDNDIAAAAAGMNRMPLMKPAADIASHAARILIKRHSWDKPVLCTIDASIQRFALERLKNQLNLLGSKNVSNGALLVADNKTGEVLAYVSHTLNPSRDFYVDGVRAKRQAGSILKPFLYAIAFEKKILTPASILDDSPLDIPVVSGIYRPQNYESDFKGLVSAKAALASSLNIPAVRTLSLVGLEPFLARLRVLGFKGLSESADYYGPSIALGSVDVTLWDIANAYRCLANDGLWSELRLTLKNSNRARRARTKRIFSRESMFLIADALSDREARSATFGLENPLATRFWTAVKTGTSKDMRDNWCVGYSARYTVGVWIGNFSGEPMWSVSGISGAAPVWVEVMNRLHANGINYVRKIPPGIVRKGITSANKAGSVREEYFIRGTEPGEVFQATGQLNRRIIYPPSGTIIALDPDIPPELQRVYFISIPETGHMQWLLKGLKEDELKTEKNGNLSYWIPNAGFYSLNLSDENGIIIDTIKFEVRGTVEK